MLLTGVFYLFEPHMHFGVIVVIYDEELRALLQSMNILCFSVQEAGAFKTTVITCIFVLIALC